VTVCVTDAPEVDVGSVTAVAVGSTLSAVGEGSGPGVAVGSGTAVFGTGIAVGITTGVSASAVAVLSSGSRATLPEQAINSRHSAIALMPETLLRMLLFAGDKSINTGLIDDLIDR
jgi:hypothetical protein